MKSIRIRTFIWLFAASAVLAAGSIGCKGPVKTSDEDLELIDYPQFVRLLESSKKKKKTIVVDARPTERFEAGHIPGAVNIPLPEMKMNDPKLAEATNIVVYSDERKRVFSHAGAKRLIALGYRNVFDYREGIEAWERQGGEVVAGK